MQLTALAAELRGRGQSLFLDFPIGSHREGFDVEHEGAWFVRDASVGAPPDAFYATGQNWGFPPVDPHGLGSTAVYLRACLDAHFRFAQVLRIDHVMGLHRLWFIPPGAAASAGAYVQYEGEEQWAASVSKRTATSARSSARTSEPFRKRRTAPWTTMRAGMWVLQFETPPAPPVPAPTAGSHGVPRHPRPPPFAAWWTAIAPAHRLTVIRGCPARMAALGTRDEPDAAAALAATYRWLGASDAAIVIAALEDLWLETEPQNLPAGNTIG